MEFDLLFETKWNDMNLPKLKNCEQLTVIGQCLPFSLSKRYDI